MNYLPDNHLVVVHLSAYEWHLVFDIGPKVQCIYCPPSCIYCPPSVCEYFPSQSTYNPSGYIKICRNSMFTRWWLERCTSGPRWCRQTTWASFENFKSFLVYDLTAADVSSHCLSRIWNWNWAIGKTIRRMAAAVTVHGAMQFCGKAIWRPTRLSPCGNDANLIGKRW
jgi:hypothetical protein